MSVWLHTRCFLKADLPLLICSYEFGLSDWPSSIRSDDSAKQYPHFSSEHTFSGVPENHDKNGNAGTVNYMINLVWDRVFGKRYLKQKQRPTTSKTTQPKGKYGRSWSSNIWMVSCLHPHSRVRLLTAFSTINLSFWTTWIK